MFCRAVAARADQEERVREVWSRRSWIEEESFVFSVSESWSGSGWSVAFPLPLPFSWSLLAEEEAELEVEERRAAAAAAEEGGSLGLWLNGGFWWVVLGLVLGRARA